LLSVQNGDTCLSVVYCIFLSFPVALQFLENLGRLLMGSFETVFSTVGRTPWTTRGRPVARPLPTQDNTTQEDADKHPCLERGSNPRSQYPSGHCVGLPYVLQWKEDSSPFTRFLFTRFRFKATTKSVPLLHYEIQSEHKRTLHFQNDTENKCGVLRTSYLHQSIEKHSKFCIHLTESRYVLRESRGRCRDDNCIRHRGPTRTLVFANAPFLLEFLVPGVNGYSAGWFHVKLCAKCTLHSCYRLFLR
jgi:hypothetical protein